MPAPTARRIIGRALMALAAATSIASCGSGGGDTSVARAGASPAAADVAPPAAAADTGVAAGVATGVAAGVATANGGTADGGSGTVADGRETTADAAVAVERRVTSVAAFGDSLSDLGSYRWGAVEEAGGGKFTTNPGPLWVEHVASHYGTTIERHRTGGTGDPVRQVTGGLGYAQGGARVSRLPGVGEEAALPVREQVTAHLRRGPIPPTQLILMLAGINDVLYQVNGYFLMVGAGMAPSAAQKIATDATAEAASDLADEVRRLIAAGARQLVVLDVPDLALTPQGFGSSADVRAQMTELTQVFNRSLDSGLAGIAGVHRVDSNALLTAVRARPADFGFVELLRPACSVAALYCTAATLTTPGAADDHLFADHVHLTSGGNLQLARHVIAAISARIPR